MPFHGRFLFLIFTLALPVFVSSGAVNCKEHMAAVQENLFETRRRLTGERSYEEVLVDGFTDSLYLLEKNDVWMDLGAGNGEAIYEYVLKCIERNPERPLPGIIGVTYRPVGGKRDRIGRTGLTALRTKVKKATGTDLRIRHLTNGPFEKLTRAQLTELGQFSVVTNAMGVLHYTDKIDVVLNKVFSSIKVGGVLYTNGIADTVRVKGLHGKSYSRTFTEFLAMQPGIEVFVQAKGELVNVTAIMKKKKRLPEEYRYSSLQIRKIEATVPRRKLRLVQYLDGTPPSRVWEYLEGL